MEKEEFRQIVRIANVDVDGFKPVYQQLTKVRGVGFSMANMVCNLIGLQKSKKAGDLSDEELKKIEKVLNDPAQAGAPPWMLNRRKDPETGKEMHIITSDLKFLQENDIKIMRKIKTYKGVRHSLGLPVRGQKTKSNFRKNKGKVAGVKKKK